MLPLIRFDDKSLDIDATNHNLQIKNFGNPASAASSTSLAADLQAQTAVDGRVLFRNSQGGLEYKSIGQLQGGGGLSGPFEPVYGEDGVDGFGKGYVQVGGFTVVSTPTGDYHENPATSGQEIVAVKISVSTSASASGSSGISAELVAYDDDEDLLSAQQSLDYVIYPIYVLAWDEDDHSSITMDLRRMPTTGALETFLTNSSASGGSGS